VRHESQQNPHMDVANGSALVRKSPITWWPGAELNRSSHSADTRIFSWMGLQ